MSILRLRPTLIVLVVVAVVVIALLWFGQRRLIYFPDGSAPQAPADVRMATLRTSDGLDLTAWLVAPTGTGRRFAVLVTPGNAGNRAGRLPLARRLAAHGMTVLLLDYRGYGGNPGHPSEDGLALDASAGLAYLEGLGFSPKQTIYFGESLGGGVASRLAVQRPPAGLVLRSPFTDLASAGSYHYPFLPVGLLLRDRYPVADNVARVNVPTVVIYGTADTTIPPEQSRTVAERAAGPVTLIAVQGADHNDAVLAEGPATVNAVVDLLGNLSG